MHTNEPAALKAALTAADSMRAADADPAQVAHWLLRLHERSIKLEELLQAVDRYLRFGMPDHELAEMRQLVEYLREHHSSEPRSDAVDDPLPL